MQSNSQTAGVQNDRAATSSGSIISAVGASFFLIMPLFLGVLAEEHGLHDAQIGYLGSAYLAGFTVVSASAVAWISKFSWRNSTLIFLVSLIVACVMMSQVQGFELLMLTLAVMGGAAGGAFAVATRVISGVKKTDRAFGLKLLAEQIVGAGLMFTIPVFVLPLWGLDGFAFCVAVLFLFLGLSAFWLPSNSKDQSQLLLSGEKRGRVLVWLGLLGIIVFMLGLSGLWAFIERIASREGLADADIGAMLSVGLLFGAVGAALSALIGDKLGHVIPHIFGSTLLLICFLLLAKEFRVMEFGVAASLFSGMWTFLLAYQMGSVARYDKDLRMTVLIAPAVALGATLGPGIAGSLVDSSGYGSVLVMAAISVIVAPVIFLTLDRVYSRSST